MTTAEGTAGGALRWLLAVLAAASGVIHLAFAGEHVDVTWAHGGFFAVVGWAQLALAVALVVRPDRRVLLAGAALSAAVVAVWAVSRTVGVPFGPGAGEAEPVALADALSTGFEAALAVLALAVAARPALAARPLAAPVARPALVVGGLAVAVASTLSLTPAFASGHAHGAGGHGAGAAAADDGHAHDGASAAEHGMSGAEHAAMPADGTGDGDGDGDGAHATGAHAAPVIQADGSSPCEQAGVANEGNSGGHGHRGPVAHEVLAPDARRDFAAQRRAADAVVADLPTVADAEAAGYRRVSPYVPCIAAHYIRTDVLMGDGFDVATPEVLLYDGTDPDSQVVGLSYLVMQDDEPEGFVGGNDVWHVHEQICMGEGGVLGIETATVEGCAARGGRMIEVGNVWMTHMWNVAGWESSWGLFSSEHPDLGGRIGDVEAPPDPAADDAWFDENPIGSDAGPEDVAAVEVEAAAG